MRLVLINCKVRWTEMESTLGVNWYERIVFESLSMDSGARKFYKQYSLNIVASYWFRRSSYSNGSSFCSPAVVWELKRLMWLSWCHLDTADVIWLLLIARWEGGGWKCWLEIEVESDVFLMIHTRCSLFKCKFIFRGVRPSDDVCLRLPSILITFLNTSRRSPEFT